MRCFDPRAAPASGFAAKPECIVECPDDIATAPDAPATPFEELPNEVLQYLLTSRYCPADQMTEQAREIAGHVRPGYAQVEAIRAWIQENIEYERGTSDESTSGLDTYQRRAGVCRDFAHVGITLWRSLLIPARMAVGYSYKLAPPMDQHAWFEVFVGGRRYTFDATQKEPKGGRIVIACGRDAADVAITTPFGPIEVDGMQVSVERLDQPSSRGRGRLQQRALSRPALGVRFSVPHCAEMRQTRCVPAACTR